MNTARGETSAREEYESNENELDEDEEEEVDDIADDSNRDTSADARHKSAMTGRGVSLSMLMADGVILPGEDCMSIEYLGQKFSGDLLPDSRIYGREEERIFGSPSAWANHCKSIVNPENKSGCGWASVKYKGKKLNFYKSMWMRKHRQLETSGQVANGEENDSDSEEAEDTDNISRKSDTNENDTTDPVGHLSHNYRPPPTQTNHANHSTSQQMNTPSQKKHGEERIGKRKSVSHKILGIRNLDHDQNTLVQVTNFVTLGKIQPFNVSVSTNCLLLMDFHSHLLKSEVMGYLAGKWDTNAQELSVSQTFPLRCRHTEANLAPKLEEEIRSNMERRGLTLVGWYHSHPESQPDPSLRDIEAQMQYQHVLRGTGNSYHPCLGIIISPYDRTNMGEQKESQIQAYWVMPPPEHRPLEYGMPMNMVFTVTQDRYFSQDILNEMKALVDYYKKESDYVNFTQKWFGSVTFVQKLESSMARKFPKDETDGRVLEYLRQLLISTSTGR